MVNTLNRLIINSLALVLIGGLAFVYYDVTHKQDLVLLDNQYSKQASQAAEIVEEPAIELVQAGTIKSLRGKVSIKSPTGEEKSLSSGDSVSVGDLVKTGKQTKAQIEFSDQSKITLYADTQLKIVDYSFIKDKPGKNIAQLLKGQLRVVSGLVGKRSGDIYQMRSHVATIGIRGTEYSLRFCYKDECLLNGGFIAPGLYMGVIDGEIIASSDSGDVIIKKGELYHQVRKDQAAEQITVPKGLLEDGDLIAAASKQTDKREWILEKVQ